MIILDSISIHGVKDAKNIKLPLEDPYFYDIEIWIKFLNKEDSYTIYTAFIANPEGVKQEFEKSKDVSFIGSKIFIFNSDMNYDRLVSCFSTLVAESKGRNVYETSILLQRHFEEQDILHETSTQYYYYLFDKIKGKR